jgi:hypothetical protein
MGTIFFSGTTELLEGKIYGVLVISGTTELLEEKIHGVLLAKCCSSLDGYKNSLPHFLHIRSLLERLLFSFFLGALPPSLQ